MEEATHTSRAAASGDSDSGEKVGGSGLRCSEPPGFRSDARVCQFHAADNGINARVVHPRGFGVAACFCVFQLWVQEGPAAMALVPIVFRPIEPTFS